MELLAEFTEFPKLLATVIVVIVAWLFPIPWQYAPLRLATILAGLFSKKVNKPNSVKQQQISGALALITYLAMIMSVVWALLFIMPADVITSSALLWISLNYDALARNNTLIASALKANQTSLARSLVANYSHSDSSKLSELGIKKTSLELQGYWFLSGWLVPVFLFVFFNGIASLIYALVVMASNTWPIFNDRYENFGKFAYKVRSVIETPVLFICLPIFIAFKNCSGFFNLYQNNSSLWPAWQNKAELMVLTLLSSGLRSEMAGPIMSEGIKVSRPRLNKGAGCDLPTITQLNNWFTRIKLFTIVIIMLFWFLGNMTSQAN